MEQRNNVLVCWLTSKKIFFLPESFIGEVIIMETYQIIKGTAPEFGDFLRFIGICMLITSKPGMNRAYYFSDTSFTQKKVQW